MNIIVFEHFRLDTVRGQLLRYGQPISLTPKAYAVLGYFLRNPGNLVTKEELLRAVWPRAHVVPGVLKVCIRELRRALSDNSAAPRFIETAHRRGYRFIANVTSAVAINNLHAAAEGRHSSASEENSDYTAPHPWYVGYHSESERLAMCFEKACRGSSQFVLVTGEPGIGKTTLIERFLADVATKRSAWVAYGRSLAIASNERSYLPLIEALNGLFRKYGGEQMRSLLRHWAPGWLAQLRLIESVSEDHRAAQTASPRSFDQPLQELIDFIRACTQERPLILAIEDLHTCDQAMVDLVNFLAYHKHPAPFMLIGTCRTNLGLSQDHPFRALLPEIKLRENCSNLSLTGLDESAVFEFVWKRLPTAAEAMRSQVARTLFEVSEGNPLFMTQLLDHWIRNGLVTSLIDATDLSASLSDPDLSLPDSVKDLVKNWFELLAPKDQRILEAASVNGSTFSALMLAKALGEDLVTIEEHCERLARQEQFLQSVSRNRLPERRAASRYAFRRRLYQKVLCQRIPIAKRAHLYAGISHEPLWRN
ncbi:MAG: ATP-binding protein [Gammaproteobacteria bacterium]